MKCQICKHDEAIWAWQPFGPDERWSFTALGCHYRGFPVIKICDQCHDLIEDTTSFFEFDFQGQGYIIDSNGKIYPVPNYVGDRLAWLMDQSKREKK